VGAETYHVVDDGDNDYFYWILNNFIFGFCVCIFIKKGNVTIMQMNTRLYENLFPYICFLNRASMAITLNKTIIISLVSNFRNVNVYRHVCNVVATRFILYIEKYRHGSD
jgi:hypothetical protein